MLSNNKIAVLSALVIFSATSVLAGGPDITTAPKKTEKVVTSEKAEKPQKKAAKKVTAKQVIDTKNSVVTSKAEEKIEVRQHSIGDHESELRVVAKNEELARKVNILFESNPTNAELIINGLYVGSTPVQVPLQRGVHNVKILSAGHDQWERQVKAYKGLRVFATLAAKIVPTIE